VVELTDGELNGDIKSFTFITPSWKRQEITVEINEGEERLASKAVPFQPNAEILSIEPDPLIAGKCMEIQVQDAVPGMSCEVDGNSVELKDSEQNGSISNFKCTAPNALGNGTLQGDVTVELKEGGNLLASKSVSYAVEFELISFKPDVLILGTRGQVTIKGYSPDMILTLGSKVCNALLAEGQEEGAEEHICNFVVPDLGEEAQEVSLSVKRAETERSTLAQYEQDNFEAHEDAKEIMALADSMKHNGLLCLMEIEQFLVDTKYESFADYMTENKNKRLKEADTDDGGQIGIRELDTAVQNWIVWEDQREEREALRQKQFEAAMSASSMHVGKGKKKK